MSMSLMLDIILAVLLAVTIIYAIVLNRRLGALRRDRSELEALAASFTEATSRADASVGRLAKNATDLQVRIDQARSLADDLSFLTDRGEKTADRLEGAVRAGRSQAPIDPSAETSRASSQGQAAAARSRPASSSASVSVAARPADEEKNSRDGSKARPDLRAEREAGDGARSEAERELLKALRSAS